MPVSSIASRTESLKRGSRNCCGDTFTATYCNAMPFASHWINCMQATFNTQLPRKLIRPIDSASGMNMDGGTSPCTGCKPADQRLHADHAVRAAARDRLEV